MSDGIFQKGLMMSARENSVHGSSVYSVVEAASSLSDEDFLAVVRAVVDARPSLVALRASLDAAQSPQPAHLPEIIVEADEIIDAPIFYATEPRIPEPDYTEGGVPTFDRVREKIEGRVGTSIGSAELAHESPAGKSVDEQWDERQKAAKAKLEEIRRSMGK
ncbi:hypothetical protein BDB13_4177 [Rhodococcus sp. OK302]|nr:hypothetical protein BDB13_4177 [Rhodococcus sp. OK302]